MSDKKELNSTIKTNITALEIMGDTLFIGIGNKLHIYNMKNMKHISSNQIFNKQRVHGIRINENKDQLVCFGNREIMVAEFLFHKISISVVSCFIVDDWIWDIRWDGDEIIILYANNIITLWNWRTQQKLKSAFNCVNCLLYCGIIIGNKWADFIVITGTMHRSILIWTHSKNTPGSNPIIHELTGHNGAIFSLCYHPKLKILCSTSDDRSARLWRVEMPTNYSSVIENWTAASITLMVTVYGHVSRVWRSVILNNGNFLTTGEDSQLRLWNKNGKPLYSWRTHQGAPIRCVIVDESNKVIVTGGGEGGVCLWPLSNMDDLNNNEELEQIKFSNDFGVTNLQDIPRRILLNKSAKLITITNKGSLFCYDGSSWHYILNNEQYASYCLLQSSQSRQFISLASIRGHVMILKESNIGLIEKIFDGKICQSKIFSFYWFDDSNFITCCEEGHVEIWVLKFNEVNQVSVTKIRNLILPLCKERWLTAAVQISSGIIVGDRDGSVHFYNNKQLNPICTYNRIHGRLGVSCLSYDDGKNVLFSIGRDGFIRHWHVRENELRLVSSNRSPIKWPVRVIQTNFCGSLIIGFNEVNFEVWNIEERKELINYKCGGGHRPWDFFLSDDLRLVFIKKKVVYNVTLSMNRLKTMSFVEGYHTREVDCLRYLGENVFISGGEDTTLRIFSIYSQNDIKSKFIIRSHISSIKGIAFIPINDLIIVVSVGGRAQIQVWKIFIKPRVTYEEIASHMLKSPNKSKKLMENSAFSIDLEPRHLDVDLHYENDTLFIYCAGSDAFWRVFTIDLQTRVVRLIKEIEYNNFCVLKIVRLTWANEKLVITFSSDGKATFWNAQTYTMIFQENLHLSSINSYDYLILDDCYLLLATGGDDTAVRISFFEMKHNEIFKKLDCIGDYLHEANVSGVKIILNYIVSVSCDQKILLWKWSLHNSKSLQINFIRLYYSVIADIHGIEIVGKNNSEIILCVYGAGFETLKINLGEN